MRSKAVALFLTLGLTTTLVACNGGDNGSEDGETGPTESNPTQPDNGEGGESSALPLPLGALLAEDLG
ncbi:MAG: hypothetical protein ACKO21_15735 [Nodosilinea sp.]|jgi:hypothetical protein